MSSLRTALDEIGLKRCGPRTIWNKVAPMKVRIHLWRTRLDRLPTKDNFVKRGISIPSPICDLYNEQPETRDHLFNFCNKAKDVRKALRTWWDFLPENRNNLEEMFSMTDYNGHKNLSHTAADIVMHPYIWEIWKARNEKIFNGKDFTRFKLRTIFKPRLSIGFIIDVTLVGVAIGLIGFVICTVCCILDAVLAPCLPLS